MQQNIGSHHEIIKTFRLLNSLEAQKPYCRSSEVAKLMQNNLDGPLNCTRLCKIISNPKYFTRLNLSIQKCYNSKNCILYFLVGQSRESRKKLKKLSKHFREMLATHLLTHTFQHTLFDWLKFTWVPPNHVGPI